MIILIDNYDSFTYNLYQYLCEYHTDVRVYRNDKITEKVIKELQPKAIVFSPGPGHPKDAGNMLAIIKAMYKCIPMLGICLGHQAIALAFNYEIKNASNMKHGESSSIHIIKQSAIFNGLDTNIMVARYHSLIVNDTSDRLMITAISDDNEIMAIEHRIYPVYGLQFHPESIMSDKGKDIIRNFVKGVVKC